MEVTPPPDDAVQPAQAFCPYHPVPADQRCDGCGHLFCGVCVITLKGRRLCGACKHASLSGSFSVYQAEVPAAWNRAPQAAPAGSVCSIHADAQGLAICERCGDFMCFLCTTPFEGKYYCLRCFELLWQRGGIMGRGSRNRGGTGLSSGALALSIGGLASFCVPVVSWVLILASLTLGVMSLAQQKGKPEAPGRAAAIIALVFSGIALVLSLAATTWTRF